MLIKSIPAVDKHSKADGTGTLRFGHNSGGYAMYEDTGLELFGRHGGSSAISFSDIPNVDQVYRLVLDRQERA